MSITFRDGNKSKNDKIYSFNGKQFTNLELFELILKLCINDDNNYPDKRIYRGGQMFINCMQEIYDEKEITDEIKKNYKL